MPPILRLRLVDVDDMDDMDQQELVDKARLSGGDEKTQTFGAKNFYHARTVPVIANREVRASNEHGSTRHIEIDISDADHVKYTTVRVALRIVMRTTAAAQ